MLDRYRPKQSTDQEDARRTARLAVEHERARERFLAAERRRRVVAICLMATALGGGSWFFWHQLQSNASFHAAPGPSTSVQVRPGKDLVNDSAVRDAVFRALQSRGGAAQKGQGAVLSDGNERRNLDLRHPEPHRESPPK